MVRNHFQTEERHPGFKQDGAKPLRYSISKKTAQVGTGGGGRDHDDDQLGIVHEGKAGNDKGGYFQAMQYTHLHGVGDDDLILVHLHLHQDRLGDKPGNGNKQR
ncbi:hypothetical protein D3C76_1537360 [compost metagenome]